MTKKFTLAKLNKPTGWLFAALLSFCIPSNLSFALGSPDSPEETGKEEVSPAPDFVTLVTAEQLNYFYTKRHENKRDGFNGCVLVAKDGVPIYTGAFGYGNFSAREKLTPQSSFQLASTTKPFTSSAILMLVEKGSIALEDSVQKFFPDFPYQGITVKNLLSHRTGLPEYIYWGKEFIGKDVDYLTNETMLNLLIKKKPSIRCRPDRMFMYCNTNYALLACIIEKVSGVSYKQFMEENIFTPLGMTNTFVFDIKDSIYHCGTACYQYSWHEWNLVFSDGVLGDKGIYSSVEDMLKWDNALKQGKVISTEMLEEAYQPRSLDKYSFGSDKTRNYGYGWRTTKQPDGSSLVYHNGNWHGCNNVFSRDLKRGYTLIVLGNKANERNYFTQAVWDIINHMEDARSVASSE
jgi:CubicO group peptidase (beta-lactamase class C family)